MLGFSTPVWTAWPRTGACRGCRGLGRAGPGINGREAHRSELVTRIGPDTTCAWHLSTCTLNRVGVYITHAQTPVDQ